MVAAIAGQSVSVGGCLRKEKNVAILFITNFSMEHTNPEADNISRVIGIPVIISSPHIAGRMCSTCPSKSSLGLSDGHRLTQFPTRNSFACIIFSQYYYLKRGGFPKEG